MGPPELPGLSPRQRAALQGIRQYRARHGRPPTRAELGDLLGVRAQTADYHLKALARKGYLRLDKGARGIAGLVDVRDVRDAVPPAPTERWSDAAARQVPILGRVAAGATIPAWAEADGSLPVPPGSRADFALRVQGESMEGAGILDGDLVLVAQRRQARHGQVVVALVGTGEMLETTVKLLWHPDGSAPVLRAAHPDYPDRPLCADEQPEIAGVVVGLYRAEPRWHG